MNKSILDRALPQETQVVDHDAFDVATFEAMKESAEALAEVQVEGTKDLVTFPPLMQDTFNSLYKYTPKIKEPETIKSSHQFNRSLIQKSVETDQYAQLRQYTKLDEVNSALATITIANKMAELIKDELKDQAEQANKLANQEDTTDQMMTMAESMADIANKAAPGLGADDMMKKAENAQRAANKARAKLQAMQDKAAQDMTGNQQKIRQAVRAAEQDAINGIKETAELMEAWGTEPGQLTQLPPAQRLELAKKLGEKEKLKKLAKMLGRFRRMAIHTQKTKIVHGLDEVHDMEFGNNLERVVPSDLMALRHPQLKKDFMRKFTENQLLQYQLRGREKTGKGPIIVCVDSSGSMDGEPELWSKAVALSLLEIAQMQKRAFAVIFFGSDSDPLEIIEIEKGEKNVIQKVIQIAEFSISGGTDFEKPLKAAIELIEKTEYKKADIAFITDGSCDVSDEFLEDFMKRKAEKECRIHSVLVDMRYTDAEAVKKFSDQITTISDLTIDAAVEIFQAV